MTDAEIIKDLEERIKEIKEDYKRLQLLDAPMDCFEESHIDNIRILSNILDLINRQKAEIERLTKELEEAAVSIFDAANRFSEYKKLMQYQKEEIERLQSILLKFVREINIFENKHNIDTSDFSLIPILENEKNNIVKQIKVEAIKEFAKRLKKRSSHYHRSNGHSVWNCVTTYDIDTLAKEMVGDTE